MFRVSRLFTINPGLRQREEEIEANDKQIKKDVIKINADELERIQNDPDLQHLVQQYSGITYIL